VSELRPDQIAHLEAERRRSREGARDPRTDSAASIKARLLASEIPTVREQHTARNRPAASDPSFDTVKAEDVGAMLHQTRNDAFDAGHAAARLAASGEALNQTRARLLNLEFEGVMSYATTPLAAVASLKTQGLHAEADSLLQALATTEEHYADAVGIQQALAEQAVHQQFAQQAAAEEANAKIEQQTYDAQQAVRLSKDNAFLEDQHSRGGNPDVMRLLDIADAAGVTHGVDLTLEQAADRSRIIDVATKNHELRAGIMSEAYKSSQVLSRRYPDGPPAVDPGRAMTTAARVESLNGAENLKAKLLDPGDVATEMHRLRGNAKQEFADRQAERVKANGGRRG
jgi:hypothetical protein